MAEKIGYLDGLRGLAALAVVFWHFLLAFYPALMFTGTPVFVTGQEWLVYSTPLNTLINGPFAVSIFFVLSGYVLTYRYFSSGNAEVLQSGAIRRYFRLLPPVVFSVICYLAILLFVQSYIGNMPALTGSELTKYFGNIMNPAAALWQALVEDFLGLSFHALGYGNNLSLYNGVLWTMSIEFIGSMIVFSFASLFGKSRNRWLFYLGAILIFSGSHYLGFIIGTLLADIVNSKTKLPGAALNKGYVNTALTWIMLLGGIFIASNNGHQIAGRVYQTVPLLDGRLPVLGLPVMPQVIGAGLVLAALLNSRLLKDILSRKLPVYLGAISFSMYLMHYMVIAVLSVPLFTALNITLGLPYSVALLITLPLSLAAIFVVSYLTHRYVDKPGVLMSKWIYGKFFTGNAKPADLKAIAEQLSAFSRKHLVTLVLIEIVLIALIGGMVFVAKPAIDHNNVIEAKNSYDKTYLETEAAYQDTITIGLCNTSSVGDYRNWVDRYNIKVSNFTSSYDNMKLSATYYQQYLDDSDQRSVSANVTRYASLLNESESKAKEYEVAYYTWYWNNTVPSF